MTYREYIALIQKLKRENEERIIGIIPDMEDLAYNALLDWMDSSLDVKSGSLVATPETVKILNDFDNGYLRVLNEIKLYSGAVSSFVKNLPDLADAIKTFQTQGGAIDWGKANIGDTQKLVVNEILNAYTDNGINSKFVQPLRDQLYQNIAAGTNFKEAKASLKDFVKSGKDTTGKLSRYLTNTAMQAVDGYTGAINKKLMNTFAFPYVIMSGSLIATSAPQCVYAINKLNGIISKADWENKVKPIAENNGLIDGTNFSNLDFNKLHHGCRHDFTPSMLKPGDKIGTNEIFKI